MLITLIIRKIWNNISLITQAYVFLEITPPAFTEQSAYTTQQFFAVLHTIGSQRTNSEKLLGRKKLFSLEIVSTRNEGIRYLIRTTPTEAKIIEHSIVSYLPSIRIKKVDDYLTNTLENKKIVEFKLAKHFAFPLAKQNILHQHDPVAYITGMMTKLKKNELMALQIVLTPVKTRETNILTHKILRNDDVLTHLLKPQFPKYLVPFSFILNIIVKIIHIVLRETVWVIQELVHNGPRQSQYSSQYNTQQQLLKENGQKPLRVLTVFEEEIIASIQEKINQELFETTIRALVIQHDKTDMKQRIRGIKSALASFSVPKYQSLKPLSPFPSIVIDKLRYILFHYRLLSLFTNTSASYLSLSEIADLYHFPFTETTKTENIAKIHAKALPAPISLKTERELDVLLGKNNYGNDCTDIGLTDAERAKHLYLIGQTGSGKTTIIFQMAKQDMEKGRGLAVIDPHGDLAKDLLYCVPEDRISDVIYFNPFDLSFPIGINLLELPDGLSEDELELEKELVCESVISIFRRLFSKEENTNAHRIEYMLRNTIHTAFTLKERTIFTVYRLLTDTKFRKEVTAQLDNEDLQNFWKNEFGMAGEYQILKMIQGVTTKVGRFLFSPTAKRVLEQERSTIQFDEIVNKGKILICNLSDGKLGEDTSQLFGTMIISKIHQAAIRRERMEQTDRKPFYLFVDEFQNFATSSFTRMLSGGRKFGLRITLAEQSTSQQEERRLTNIILANTGTVVCFRTASPLDEQLMLVQFVPYIERLDIVNLPNYTFYIKISATIPEEPFSGETLPIAIDRNSETLEKIINASRKNYAIVYKKPIKQFVLQKEKEQKGHDEDKNDISVL